MSEGGEEKAKEMRVSNYIKKKKKKRVEVVLVPQYVSLIASIFCRVQ